MKGLKNKMSIKAFCKRGLAVMLACAMVAPGVVPVMQTQAAVISSGDEWITTANGLEVKITTQYGGEDANNGVMAGKDQEGVSGGMSTANIQDVVDGDINTGVIFRRSLSGYNDTLAVGDYIQVEFKEAIGFNGVAFLFEQGNGNDIFGDSTLTYTTDENVTDKSVWDELGNITSGKNMCYQAEASVKHVKAIRLTNNSEKGAWVRLREIVVDAETPVYAVGERYVPGSNDEGIVVEDGRYAIVGLHNMSYYKAINSNGTLTFTSVVDYLNSDINNLPKINKSYEWDIKKVEGGYYISAVDEDGYLKVVTGNSEAGGTVSKEPQVLKIALNNSYSDREGAVSIGIDGGYINARRNNGAGTWTSADGGSTWWLYKVTGYKVSELFVSDAISTVVAASTYTEESWANYEAAKAAVELVYTTEVEAQAKYDTLIEAVENLVKKVPVTDVTLEQNKVTIDEIGATVTLTAIVNPESAVNKNLVWTTDNADVATVVDGVVKAVGNGVAIITVKTEDGGFTATCEVVVEEIEETIALYVGENITKEISHGGEIEVVDSSVATAEVVTTETKNVVLYNRGESEVNKDISIENAAWKFTQVEGGWNIYNEATGLYFVNSRNVGFGSQTPDVITVDVVENQDGAMESVQIWRPEGQSKRYVIYYGGGTQFDAVSVANTSQNDANGTWVYNLKLLEYTGTGEFGGWSMATEVKNGSEYVIAHVTDAEVFVLYPQAAKSDSATKKAELLTTKEHSIKVNALTAGTTNVWVGNKIYKIEVAEFVVVATAGSLRRTNNDIQADGFPEKDPSRMVDGNRDNNWLSDPADSLVDSWVNFELPKAKIVDGLKLYYGAANYIHKAYEVLVSTDGQNWTKVCEGTFENTAGEKTIKFKPVEAKHVRLVPTDKYGQELAIWEAEILYSDVATEEWFIGGSLRMDYADDYDKTCLRFMYEFPSEFNGMTVDATTEDNDGGSWKWTYGKTESMGNTKGVADGRWQVKDNGMVESNIVFTNIGRSNYSTSLYTQLAVTYSDASGANTLTVYDTVVAERSVNDVAGAIENAYKDSVDEREVKQYNYALGILGKTASAQ